MSFTITEAMVRHYTANVTHLAQQKKSRLRNTVRFDGEVIGLKCAFERLAPTAARKRTTRYDDTPLMNVPHSRRWAHLEDYDWADLINPQDKDKVLIDPQSAYVINGAGAMGKSWDDVIIAAIGGNADEGVDGGTAIALPSAQKLQPTMSTVTADMTLAKLISAKTRLMGADIDDDEELFVALTSAQIDALLNENKLTSMDYNTVKTLVNGNIASFMGFTFVRTERLLTTTGGGGAGTDTIRLCYAWSKIGVGLAMGQDIKIEIEKRPDKAGSPNQVQATSSLGAVRVDDKRVVEIACNETV